MRSAATVPGLSFSVSPPLAEPSPLRSDVAGFIGRTKRGPDSLKPGVGEPIRFELATGVGIPTRVEGWRGYQREFGGLDRDAAMTYAIRGYFENEGEVAHVIRLCHPSATLAGAGPPSSKRDNDFATLAKIQRGQWETTAPELARASVPLLHPLRQTEPAKHCPGQPMRQAVVPVRDSSESRTHDAFFLIARHLAMPQSKFVLQVAQSCIDADDNRLVRKA